MNDLEKRFWSKVAIGDGCWNWTAGPLGYRKTHYGQFWFRGSMRRATRVAWEIVNGRWPGEMHVLHKCDNPRCVRPSHLFLGTAADNMQDMKNKGRGDTGARGEKHHQTPLKKSDVVAIRADSRLQKTIAAAYGISQTAVSNIKLRKSWRHVV
jgi:hypothetical protein